MLSGNEKKYVLDCLDSTWISSKGKYVERFEKEFSDFIGVESATTVCNGTVALHLALLALGIGEGDEVIVPTLTYIAPVNAVTYVGAKPIFVDSIKESWQMNPSDIERKISTKTRAIIAVHLYGHPCDMDSIMKIARDNNLFVIEDCAESLGSTYKGRHTGCIGDISTFSFFGNKTITTGEGGMVASNNHTLLERAIHLKRQGLAQHREYWHDVIGHNFRMTNICAAIGLAQLEQAHKFLEKKRIIASWYKDGLDGLPIEMLGEVGDVINSYWMTSILTNNAFDREPLRLALMEAGVETRPMFFPVHTMPMYGAHYQSHPVAESLGTRGINLPSWPGLTFQQVQFINELIHSYFEKK